MNTTANGSPDAPKGTLTDADIIALAHEGRLIVNGFSEARIKQACYELSASETYYDLAAPDRPRQAGADGNILLKPKQILVFITEEELQLPPDILGRVLSKGQLFSLGVVPVNTYADPGFSGKLGIVLINASNDYLRIPPGMTIAKIEFVRLHHDVSRPYDGQHGYQTHIWPIRHDLKLTPQEIKDDKRIEDPTAEVVRAYGPDFGAVVERVFRYERRLLLAAAVYLTTLVGVIALAFGREERLGIVAAVVLGIVSNLGFWLLTWFATNLRRKG
ncbi:dCTP deaminase [Ornithinimicrobium sediminis]|uniref:dCTP deaminase n=1 Tax=Ornithinimicrobium sediminis TaxID=2904603 RepID=UPI001E5B5F6F|nr:hypothetical protein [Ornithinimicrobium sediminis]MCE0485869.1 hypothetical protein [Ornithinimicrobium sediminis]